MIRMKDVTVIFRWTRKYSNGLHMFTAGADVLGC